MWGLTLNQFNVVLIFVDWSDYLSCSPAIIHFPSLYILFAVSVGYEYETCPSLVLWEKRTAVLQGYELEPTNLGGWSLDKHHILNLRSGILFSSSVWSWPHIMHSCAFNISGSVWILGIWIRLIMNCTWILHTWIVVNLDTKLMPLIWERSAVFVLVWVLFVESNVETINNLMRSLTVWRQQWKHKAYKMQLVNRFYWNWLF